jgi:hypothetical protein
MADRDFQSILGNAAELFRATFTHAAMVEFFTERSVPMAEGTSKRTYAYNTLESLPRARALDLILEVAQGPTAFGLQEAIYRLQDERKPQISEISRRAIAKAIGTGLHGNGAKSERLAQLFLLETFESQLVDLIGGRRSPTLKELIDQYASGEKLVWDATDIFERIGAFRCSTRRFIQLLDDTLDPLLREAAAQLTFVQMLQPLLKVDHYEVAEVGQISGRKTYAVRQIQRGVDGRAKNLIFASIGPKPLLGFRDAIDNDIAILAHGESCLIYDRPIGDGLRWSELVAWWAEREGVSDDSEARKTLGSRLQLSLNEGPERDLFNTYFKTFTRRLGETLPALIPQVYLHYDPEVVSRVVNRDALLRQRMDFLLLFPGRQRIVIEIDGKQHYAEGDLASPRLYAEMVAADRELRLRGYEIYRFGGYELSHNRTPEVAVTFFERLFAAHRIT